MPRRKAESLLRLLFLVSCLALWDHAVPLHVHPLPVPRVSLIRNRGYGALVRGALSGQCDSLTPWTSELVGGTGSVKHDTTRKEPLELLEWKALKPV